MFQLEWNEKYEVGNPEIDSEHKIFVRILQKIICSSEKKENHAFTERLIYQIYKYADFHFFSEETLMMEIHYPAMGEHKKEHDMLLMELRNNISVTGNENYQRPLDDFIRFVTDWFVSHSVKMDKKLADFIEKNKVCTC